MIAAALLEGEAEALMRKTIEKAKSGDGPCLRLCVDRLLPPPRDRPVRFPLPPMDTATAATQAVASGDLTPLEGKDIASLIEIWLRTFETTEIERRLQALEQRSCAA
jgi:hypothetical protein